MISRKRSLRIKRLLTHIIKASCREAKGRD